MRPPKRRSNGRGYRVVRQPYTRSYVSRVVKRTVDRMSETKEGFYTYSNCGGNAADFSSFGYGAASACASLVAGITAGTGSGQRIGRQIFVRGVQVSFMMQPGDSYNNIRFVLVRPRGQADLTNNAVFVQQVLSGVSSSGTQWANPVDTDIYQVLWDRMFTMRKLPLDGNSSNTVNQNKLIRKYIKINQKFTFDTSASNLRDLWLIGISDSAAIAHPGAIAGFVKVWFKDL